MEPAGILRVPHTMIRSIKPLVSGALLLLSVACAQAPERSLIRVHYLGHASFLFTLDNGLTVLTDYGESMAYGLNSPVYELGGARPDVVTLSHNHADHAGGALPEGVGPLITGAAGYESRGLTITPIPTFEQTLQTPDNTSYLFEYQGMKALHLGDCQALMTGLDEPGVTDRVNDLYPDTYDLVLLPIGYTRDILAEAAAFVKLLDAQYVIPMHYWDPQDRDTFLAMLDGAADSRERKYEVRGTSGAGFDLPGSSGDRRSVVQVIGLRPAPVPRGSSPQS